MRRGCLEISKFGQGLGYPVWSSCNGLILTRDPRYLRFLYVSDPLTKQRAILPPYFHQIKTHEYFRLAFDEASMEYKVVQARHCGLFPSKSQNIEILTVGVDRVWRRIDVEHLSLISREAFISKPLVTGAFIHWIGTTFILTLNVETETIFQFPLPPQSQHGLRKFLPMGSNLSVVCGSSELYRDVWEMNPESGTWTMLLRFDLRPLICKFPDLFPHRLKFLDPLGWLEAGEVLFFNTKDTQKCCVAYNIKTSEMQLFEVYTLIISYHFQPRDVNNLVRLEE
ncbi:F-box protein At5g07610-like [Henckelia pumila]|uniref:F-box protein At5g07610-like n=1 Tax=Henckelia pumila TaxID=405737 RepID=UPI003C6E4D29